MNDARGAVTGEAGTAPPPPTGDDPPGGASADARTEADERAPERFPADAAPPLDGPLDAPLDGPLDAPLDGPLELPPDASVHAHVLEDPLRRPSVVDTAETPLFAGTLPMYARTAGPGGDVASGVPVLPPTPSADLPFSVALAAVPGAGPGGPERHTHVGPSPVPLRRRRAFRRTVAVVLTLLLLGLAALSTYLFRSAQGWRDRADSYLDTSLDLGDELTSTRSQLSGSQAELEAVRAQLATTHERIVELADEKNQALDDWEITQQLVDYQQRVSDAAGQVALALDQCVQGQQELIGYLQASAEPGGPIFDPAQLTQFETDVEALCQAASEANIALQRELAR